MGDGLFHPSFKPREDPDIFQDIGPVHEDPVGGPDPDVFKERCKDAGHADEIVLPPAAGNGKDDPFLSRALFFKEPLRMVLLHPVDEELERAGDGVGVHGRTDRQYRGAPDRGNDLPHVILKNAGAGIIALVAADAMVDIHVVRPDDPDR